MEIHYSKRKEGEERMWKRIVVKNKVKDVMLRLRVLPIQELCEIYQKTNSWDWDLRMGDEPEDWEQLVICKNRWWKEKCSVTRYSYIKPINEYIRNAVSEKELLRYHHIHNLHRTNEEFEMWWRDNAC